MRIVIVGAGAVGSVVGAHLAKAGTDVLLIGDPPHVEKIRAHGLKMSGRYGTFTVTPPACFAPDDWQPRTDDVVFLCVKTYDTAAAVERLRAKLPADTPVFCFQNTMANEEMVAARFANVYGVALHLGARFVFPGEVSHLGGNSLVIGRYPRGMDATAERVIKVLQDAGLGGASADDITACKWAKFCINLLNAPCAILDLSGPEAVNDPDARPLLADMLDEAQQVLARAEVTLSTLPGDRPLPDTIRALRRPDFTPKPLPERASHVFPSMWQDVYCRRGRTEARWLNGLVAEMGRKLGVDAPVNVLLAEVVDDMAERRELPGAYRVADLREKLAMD